MIVIFHLRIFSAEFVVAELVKFDKVVPRRGRCLSTEIHLLLRASSVIWSSLLNAEKPCASGC